MKFTPTIPGKSQRFQKCHIPGISTKPNIIRMQVDPLQHSTSMTSDDIGFLFFLLVDPSFLLDSTNKKKDMSIPSDVIGVLCCRGPTSICRYVSNHLALSHSIDKRLFLRSITKKTKFVPKHVFRNFTLCL